MKLAQDYGRQRALAEDAQGWHPSRLWSGGVGRGGITNRGSVQPEGLNERGEAPPPYHHGEPVLNEHGRSIALTGQTGQYGSSDHASIPLQNITRRSDSSMKPPDYLETVVESRGRSSSSHISEEWERPRNPPRSLPD